MLPAARLALGATMALQSQNGGWESDPLPVRNLSHVLFLTQLRIADSVTCALVLRLISTPQDVMGRPWGSHLTFCKLDPVLNASGTPLKGESNPKAGRAENLALGAWNPRGQVCSAQCPPRSFPPVPAHVFPIIWRPHVDLAQGEHRRGNRAGLLLVGVLAGARGRRL